MNTLTQEQLFLLASELGADMVGSCELPFAPIPELPTLKYALSVGVKLSNAVLKNIAFMKYIYK